MGKNTVGYSQAFSSGNTNNGNPGFTRSGGNGGNGIELVVHGREILANSSDFAIMDRKDGGLRIADDSFKLLADEALHADGKSG